MGKRSWSPLCDRLSHLGLQPAFITSGKRFAVCLDPMANQRFVSRREKGLVKSVFAIYWLGHSRDGRSSARFVEGMVYTQLPIADHLWGLPEVIIQTMLFSFAVVFWYKKPSKVEYHNGHLCPFNCLDESCWSFLEIIIPLYRRLLKHCSPNKHEGLGSGRVLSSMLTSK